MKFFIGSLSLDLPDPEEDASLQEADRLFLHAVLPVTKQVDVRLEPAARICIPDSAEEIDENLLTWNEDDTSCRAFRCRAGWCCISRRTGNSVVIDMAAPFLNDFRRHFRPWFHVFLEEFCLENQSLLFYASPMSRQGRELLFTSPASAASAAPNELWHRYLSSNTDVGSGRVLLQKTPEGWFSCDFSLDAPSPRGNHKAHPIDTIVLLSQGQENQIEELTEAEKVCLLCTESIIPSTRQHISLATNLLRDLVREVRVIRYACDLKDDAIPPLLDYLFARRDSRSA